MFRFLTFVLITATLGSAFFLYAVNYQTRALEEDLKAARLHQEELSRDVETLRAERAYLSRPERIGPAARALGMRPADGGQFTLIKAASAEEASSEDIQQEKPKEVLGAAQEPGKEATHVTQ